MKSPEGSFSLATAHIVKATCFKPLDWSFIFTGQGLMSTLVVQFSFCPGMNTAHWYSVEFQRSRSILALPPHVWHTTTDGRWWQESTPTKASGPCGDMPTWACLQHSWQNAKYQIGGTGLDALAWRLLMEGLLSVTIVSTLSDSLHLPSSFSKP